MKGPSCETIPGETPIPHKGEGAGGLSYFSSGSVGSGLCCPASPEATVLINSKNRQAKKLAVDTPRDFQPNKRIAQHRPTSTERPPVFHRKPLRDYESALSGLRNPLSS